MKSLYPAASTDEITPICWGNSGNGRLRAASHNPSAISFFFNNSNAFLIEPSPIGRIVLTVNENLPHLVTLGRATTATFIPSCSSILSIDSGIKQFSTDSSSFRSKNTHLPWLTLKFATSPTTDTVGKAVSSIWFNTATACETVNSSGMPAMPSIIFE